MNTTRHGETRRSSDVTAVDIAAIATMLVSVAIAIVAGALVSWKLMWVAAAIAIPAAVAKVWSTRAKAAHREDHPSDRDRRVFGL